MQKLFENFYIENKKYVYIPLYIFLKNKIEEKKLQNKLPPIRKVASYLNISCNTVAKAYSELERINYVTTIKGSGIFINEIFLFSKESIYSSIENDDALTVNNKINIDFINSSPNFSFLPIKDIKKAINFVLDKEKEMALINEGVLGSLQFRKSIQNTLESINIFTDIENIHILSGAQQGIDLISKVLAFPKDNIVAEFPTYLGAINSFKNQNININYVTLESDGIDINKLEKILTTTKIKFLYIMVNFQTPTGIDLSHEKKLKLLELSKKYDFYIIEDDSASDLYYTLKPPSSLKSIDFNNRVIYIKSYSKIFMPGFRIGFILLPTELISSFLNNKVLVESNTSTLYQKSFSYLLNEGLIEKHMTLCRKNFKKIQKSIIEELKKIDSISFEIPNGGCSLWIKLPENISSLSVYNKLLKDGVGIVPGNNYGFDNYIKINFSRININDAISGIKLLKNSIEYFQYLNI